jgi:hypothetical protein
MFDDAYIEGLEYCGKDDPPTDSLSAINQSSILDDLAEKLTDNCMRGNANYYLSQTHYKARMPNVISAICITFALIKEANGKPIYLVKNEYDDQRCEAYYFFIGTFEEISELLAKLIKGDGGVFGNQNLKTYKW